MMRERDIARMIRVDQAGEFGATRIYQGQLDVMGDRGPHAAEIAEMAGKYSVSVPQLCIRYLLQLGLLPLPKTANPDHMRNNADVDFEISDADMETLKNAKPIEDYGDASVFPVYGGTM